MNGTNVTPRLLMYVRFAVVVHSLVLVLFLLHAGEKLFIPLFAAFLVAVSLYPLTRLCERLGMRRVGSAVVPVVLFVVLIGIVIFYFTLQVSHLLRDLPALQSKGQMMIVETQSWAQRKMHLNLVRQTQDISRSFNEGLMALTRSLGATFLNSVEILVLFIFFIFFTFFILLYRNLLKRFVYSFFSRTQQESVSEIMTRTRSLIKSYIIGLLTEMGILMLLIFLSLYLMGVKYALLMGVLAAILNIIPYIGIYTAAAVCVLLTVINGTGFQALEVAIVFIMVHVIDANVLVPKIVGGRVKINPFITLIAIMAGRMIWGIPGMFLFIPLTAMLRIISERIPFLKPWAILLGEEKP